MSLRQIILLIVSAIYFWLCHAFINKICNSCDDCGNKTRTEEAISSSAVAQNNADAISKIKEPIIFNWDNPDGITTSTFPKYRDNIANELKDGQNLEVRGFYFKAEATPDGFANMGLARANELIELLSESVPKERMVPVGILIPEKDGVREYPFISTDYRWIAAPVEEEVTKEEVQEKEPEAPAKEAPVEEIPEEEEARVVETDDEALIYFPFNSITREMNNAVDSYLEKLAQRLKESGETVTLTGHTDDVGSEAANYGLAERRAKMIRDILREKGVPRNKIVTKTEGENSPIVPNDSDKNRRLNRRVEVVVN